jgi:GTP-binding protein
VDNYLAIRAELKQYDVDLADRPELVAVSKAELPGADQVRERLADATGGKVLLFSSVTGQGLNELVRSADNLLNRERQAT